MTLREFLELALRQVEAAVANGDRGEAVRVLRVMGSECDLQAQRLESTRDAREFRRWKPS